MRTSLAWLLLLISIVQCQLALAESPADLVVTGANIYTVDACRSWAQAMAVEGGRIVYVGNNEGASKFVGPDTRQVKLQGEMVLPGFHDCHVHPVSSGIDQELCTLDGLGSREQVLKRIAEYRRDHHKDAFITGSGWGLPLFADASPNKADLDQIIADRSAYFVAQDGHSGWANSRALKLAGINKSTPDPANGKIVRNADGEPTGTLRESAMDLVEKRLPKPTDSQCLRGLALALKMANGFGITSLQDACAREQFLQAYRALESEGKLTMRVVAALYVDPQKDSRQVDELTQLRQRYSSALVKPTSAKMFADGVIESHTAALLAPYADRPDYSGDLHFAPQQMEELVKSLDKAGFQVHIHAIGDGAVNEALNSFEQTLTANGRNDNRHQIAHLEMIQPSDIPRFRKLGVIANFQPFWAYADPYITQCTEPLLGPERSQRLYQLRSVADTGAMVAAGSDWSVTTLNPLDAIQVAVTRQALDDTTGKPWLPYERMSLAKMIAVYTICGAYTNHQEDSTGSLEPGKAADFIVLDKNLFEIPASEIHNTKVLATYLNGTPVFKRQAER